MREFCRDNLLPFLFADAEDDRQQYTLVVYNVAAKLKHAVPLPEGGVTIEGRQVRTFVELAELLDEHLNDDTTRALWAGPAVGQGTVNAFVRRLYGKETLLDVAERRRSLGIILIGAEQTGMFWG